MLGELRGEIEDSGVQAGWIKLSVGDDGITDCEAKILRAAAGAAGAGSQVADAAAWENDAKDIDYWRHPRLFFRTPGFAG